MTPAVIIWVRKANPARVPKAQGHCQSAVPGVRVSGLHDGLCCLLTRVPVLCAQDKWNHTCICMCWPLLLNAVLENQPCNYEHMRSVHLHCWMVMSSYEYTMIYPTTPLLVDTWVILGLGPWQTRQLRTILYICPNTHRHRILHGMQQVVALLGQWVRMSHSFPKWLYQFTSNIFHKPVFYFCAYTRTSTLMAFPQSDSCGYNYWTLAAERKPPVQVRDMLLKKTSQLVKSAHCSHYG